jgi:hypothetical protein
VVIDHLKSQEAGIPLVEFLNDGNNPSERHSGNHRPDSDTWMAMRSRVLPLLQDRPRRLL